MRLKVHSNGKFDLWLWKRDSGNYQIDIVEGKEIKRKIQTEDFPTANEIDFIFTQFIREYYASLFNNEYFRKSIYIKKRKKKYVDKIYEDLLNIDIDRLKGEMQL